MKRLRMTLLLLLLLMTVGCDAVYYTLSHKAAAKFTASSPEAQKRLIWMPGTWSP